MKSLLITIFLILFVFSPAQLNQPQNWKGFFLQAKVKLVEENYIAKKKKIEKPLPWNSVRKEKF